MYDIVRNDMELCASREHGIGINNTFAAPSKINSNSETFLKWFILFYFMLTTARPNVNFMSTRLSVMLISSDEG
jgi:hypothetical protein